MVWWKWCLYKHDNNRDVAMMIVDADHQVGYAVLTVQWWYISSLRAPYANHPNGAPIKITDEAAKHWKEIPMNYRSPKPEHVVFNVEGPRHSQD